MTIPDKCPYCGATEIADSKFRYTCRSFREAGTIIRLPPCYEAEITKLKAERDVLRLCVVSARDLLASMDVGYETQAVLRAVLERVTP